ncbi:MAG: hypothetical protein NTV06_04230 [candidate division Zixibacteria bacterium]|nr:hypothetical protein [candidate division Zixibacteria bacterium]
MKINRTTFTIIILFAFFILYSPVILGQTQEKGISEGETIHKMEMKRPAIEGLEEFHDILRPIWHTFLCRQ